MKYERQEYVRFLCTELEAQEKSYEQIVKTKATVLKVNGEVFVGMFLRINEAGFAIFPLEREAERNYGISPTNSVPRSPNR